MQTLPKLCVCEALKLTFKNYFKCCGRARRSEFFISFIFFSYLFEGIILGLINIIKYINGSLLNVFVPILSILIFLTSWPLIILIIRRLHDTGRSGYYIFILCIPLGFIPILYFLFLDSEKETNKYGPSPKYIHKDFLGLENDSCQPTPSDEQYYYIIK